MNLQKMKLLYLLLVPFTMTLAQAQEAPSNQCEILHCNEESVGIGTVTVPTGYKLAVAGNVLMENGRVDLEAQWPDYVFEKDYKLLDVQVLKRYIQANGHLPNVPAAATVKKEGIDVAEMNTVLMQKIEELSLYIIQLQDRLNKLQQAKAQRALTNTSKSTN